MQHRENHIHRHMLRTVRKPELPPARRVDGEGYFLGEGDGWHDPVCAAEFLRVGLPYCPGALLGDADGVQLVFFRVEVAHDGAG